MPAGLAAPSDNPLGARPNKPRPDGVEIRSDRDKTSALVPNPIDDAALPIGARLSAMNADMTGVEATQLRAVARIAASVEKSAAKIRTAMADTGLSLRRISGAPTPSGSQAAMGGPFVPVTFDEGGSPFESSLAQLQTEILDSQRITRALPRLPFRQPLAGALVTTSPFGIRVDPFFGRMAMHTGNDFRGAFGARVMATAAGKVVFASYDGGYGNMVEIDHGNGLTTRYAHLSAFTVVKGQEVQAGQEVGQLGSTGRSTGPHLHYEVRIDGRPVDPIPFVKAGERLFASR
jgi:murein DD-endopeptidase MepM/ murein hydrolase activator NlpD